MARHVPVFCWGLLTGFVETKFANPRMGAGSALEGVMNGTFLVALGAVWMEVRLPFETQSRSLLERALWSLCKLGNHRAGSGLGICGAFSYYRRGPQRFALAGRC